MMELIKMLLYIQHPDWSGKGDFGDWTRTQIKNIVIVKFKNNISLCKINHKLIQNTWRSDAKFKRI